MIRLNVRAITDHLVGLDVQRAGATVTIRVSNVRAEPGVGYLEGPKTITVDGWVKCDDRLPIPDQRVIYYFEKVGTHVGRFKSGTCQADAIFAGASGWLAGDVTHWMPSPEDPPL